MGIGENVGENVGENTGQSGIKVGLPLLFSEDFSVDPLPSPQWYDERDFVQDSGRYRASWLNTEYENCTDCPVTPRRTFTASDEISVSCSFQTTSGFGLSGSNGAIHLFYIKDTEAGIYEPYAEGCPTPRFTLYFEINQNSSGDGKLRVDFRQRVCPAVWDDQWSAMDDLGSYDLFDNAVHQIKYYAKMNDLSVANGLLKCWVDGELIYSVSDMEYRTIAGQNFNYIGIGPYISTVTATSDMSFYIDNLVVRGV